MPIYFLVLMMYECHYWESWKMSQLVQGYCFLQLLSSLWLFQIKKGLKKTDTKKPPNNPIKIGQKTATDRSPKKASRWQINTWKDTTTYVLEWLKTQNKNWQVLTRTHSIWNAFICWCWEWKMVTALLENSLVVM